MSKTTISFRTNVERRDALDALAGKSQRDRSFVINEAIEQYIDTHSWHTAYIEKGLQALDRGETITHAEMKTKFQSLRATLKSK